MYVNIQWYHTIQVHYGGKKKKNCDTYHDCWHMTQTKQLEHWLHFHAKYKSQQMSPITHCSLHKSVTYLVVGIVLKWVWMPQHEKKGNLIVNNGDRSMATELYSEWQNDHWLLHYQLTGYYLTASALPLPNTHPQTTKCSSCNASNVNWVISACFSIIMLWKQYYLLKKDVRSIWTNI